jgi:CRISPR system Cascade subunit CasD
MSADRRWLVLHLEAPLLAFGGVAIDQVGITRDFPAASMLTGLLANALGWQRAEWQAHQALQDRLIFAARRDRENPTGILTDMQNARLEKTDRGWTTYGTTEGRAGASYMAPHRRQREYHADACVTVVLRLEPASDSPDLDAIAAALNRPARPLFLGRKPCLPSHPLCVGEILASSAYEALRCVPAVDTPLVSLRALWPPQEGPTVGLQVHRIVALPDLRNWKTGLHGGTRLVVEGTVEAEGVPA